ncbi:hypothetical protein NDU88_005771 [Pleurodeles waltl]|uniref:Uncharacterized protein n=1 Tax=Pleurodeles waltl TaxID=8319 RepID=A0AAV7N6T4_PLEWA|nr:hypothetical protein NDU88_005771 [Pleurodeles waltl]
MPSAKHKPPVRPVDYTRPAAQTRAPGVRCSLGERLRCCMGRKPTARTSCGLYLLIPGTRSQAPEGAGVVPSTRHVRRVKNPDAGLRIPCSLCWVSGAGIQVHGEEDWCGPELPHCCLLLLLSGP